MNITRLYNIDNGYIDMLGNSTYATGIKINRVMEDKFKINVFFSLLKNDNKIIIESNKIMSYSIIDQLSNQFLKEINKIYACDVEAVYENMRIKYDYKLHNIIFIYINNTLTGIFTKESFTYFILHIYRIISPIK